jgi:hypothetical protein
MLSLIVDQANLRMRYPTSVETFVDASKGIHAGIQFIDKGEERAFGNATGLFLLLAGRPCLGHEAVIHIAAEEWPDLSQCVSLFLEAPEQVDGGDHPLGVEATCRAFVPLPLGVRDDPPCLPMDEIAS